MTTPNDPNAQPWNQPAAPPAEEPAIFGQPQAPQYGQAPAVPAYSQPQQYNQPGAYPQMGYPAATMVGGVPSSITTASVLLFIFGGLAAIIGLLFVVGGSSISSSSSLGPFSSIGNVLAAIGVIFLANAALDIVCALKIRAAKAWARITAIVVSAIWLALWVWGLINGGSSGTTSTGTTSNGGNPVVPIVFIGMTGLIIYFLAFEQKAKEFFAGRR
ncbi:MAG: hypothetical protein JWM93_1363 [Frankiales bacterium]|nr:hypothetical protein [Frankiales bacterium]